MDQPTTNAQVDRRAKEPAEIRFIRIKEVTAICGMSKTTVYEAIKHAGFPKPVRLYGRTTAWVKSEVLHWAQLRKDAFRAEHPA